jgi:hypothetical protein
MISKELITQVLRGYPKYSEQDECTGNITYKVGSNIIHFEVNSNMMSQYNVYEFAYKCKEWAMSKGFIIITYGEAYYNVDVHYKNNKSQIGRMAFYDTAQEEPEAIFKACQWILDNKEIK